MAPGRARGPGSRGLGGEQVEGRQAVRELILAGNRRVREVLVAVDPDDDADRATDELADLALDAGVTVREVTRSRLLAEARSEAPQGIVARAAALPEHLLEDLVVPRPGAPVPFLVVAEGITDPGNLGALLRVAECAGATGAVLPRHRAVHITPTAAKAAAGAIEYLPMALVGGVASAVASLRDAGVLVVGLDMAGEPLFELDLGPDVPVALVLGSEGQGLSRLVRQRCDVLASIPLHGSLASLNVAAAAAVACYEVARRR